MPTASGGQSASGSAGQFDVYRRATVSGHPALVYAASAGGSFGFGTSPPVVTSDESASGSAVVWIVYSPNGSGAGAELRAYDPIPQNGTLHLLQSWPVGTATKFTPPGVGQRKVYVGTRDGHVLGFGAPASAPLTPGSGAFPATTVGESSSRTISLHAERTVTVRSLALAGDAAFTTGTPSPALPVTLHTGDTLTVPATFSPTSAGLKGATLTATTDQEPVAVSLSGTAQAQGPLLTIDAPMIDFGGVTLGSESRRAVTLANAGGSTLHVSAVSDPGGPFSVEGIAAGQTIEPGASITAIVGFTPTATGDFGGTLRVDSDTTAPAGKDPADMGTVGLTGAGATPPELVTEPSGLDFGVLAPGTSALQSVVVRNAGGSVLTVYKSKPPSGGPFTALDRLDEGTTLQAGQSRALRIQFAPQAPGAFTGAWDITANDATGARSLTFTGTAGTASPPASAVTPSPAPATSPAAGSPPAATPARVSSVSSLKLAAWRFRTRTNLRVRATGVTRVRITLERRAGSRWVRRAGARDVRLVDGVRTVTVSARGLRAGRWRVVVAPLPNGTARHAEFFVAR
jgi:iron transport multicopper oxidase